MNHSTSTARHRLLACAEVIEKALDSVAHSDPVYLPTAEKADLLVRLTRLSSQVEALRLRVVAASGGRRCQIVCVRGWSI